MHMRSIGVVLAVLIAQQSQAQPPWIVDWIQEGILWDDYFRGVRIQPGNGQTVMFIGDAYAHGFTNCHSNVVARTFSLTGEAEDYLSQGTCLAVVGISQMFCAYEPGIIVCVDVGVSIPTVWVSGIHYSGWFEPVAMNSGPGTFSTTDPTRHALLVSGGNFFLGGQSAFLSNLDSVECADRIWKTPYPTVDLGTSWTSCMDHPFKTFEMWHDTLLAIGFPTVTKVDTTNGSQAGTFDLFSGTAVNNGHTTISGDTLFWASRLSDSQLHVGRYLIGSGPAWEVTLPFNGYPVELHRDGYGRLWTAAGGNVIQVDQATGAFQSYPYGLIVNGLDMVGNTVAITGTVDGTTSYVLHGYVTP